MTTPAVEERPAVTETPKAEPVEEPKAPSTDPNGEVQTQENPDPARTEGEPSVAAPPDTRAQRVAALSEAERAEIVQQTREATLAEVQGRTPEQLKQATKQRLQQLFPQTIQTVDQVIEAARDELGNARPLTFAETKRIKDAFENYNRTAAETAEEAVATTVQQVAYNLLPKEAQDVFTQLTAEDTTLPNFLNAWVETAAIHTKAVKAMDLDTAMKTSSKLKREILARDIEVHDAGYEEGLNAPAGSSPKSRNNERTAPGQLSFVELEGKYGRGETTAAETREYERLRDERKKASR